QMAGMLPDRIDRSCEGLQEQNIGPAFTPDLVRDPFAPNTHEPRLRLTHQSDRTTPPILRSWPAAEPTIRDTRGRWSGARYGIPRWPRARTRQAVCDRPTDPRPRLTPRGTAPTGPDSLTVYAMTLRRLG